jgi:uncharacterized protein
MISIGPIDLLIFQSTPFCNLDCSYCYLPDRGDKSKINIKTVEIALKNLVDEDLLKGNLNLLWHAGEPLVMPIAFYKQIIDLTNEIIPNYINVVHQFQTNATLITQEWCDFFLEFNINVGVSIDGPKDLNDYNRKYRSGKGSYDNIIAGIELLKKNEVKFSAIAVVTENSLDFPEKIYNFFKEMKVTTVGFNIDEIEGVNANCSIDQGSEEKIKQFWKVLFKLQTIPGNFLNIREIHEFNGALLHDDFVNKLNLSGQMTTPLAILSIDHKGDFSTFSPELLGMKHDVYEDFIFGNVHENSFKSIEHNPKFIKVFDDINKGISSCYKSCDYFSLCGGGAPSNKLYENGTFNSTETKFCRYTKKFLTDVFLDEIESGLNITS